VLRYKIITVSTPVFQDNEETITAILKDHGFHVHTINYEKNTARGEFVYNFTVSSRDKDAIRKTFLKLSSADFVNTLKIG
jgi:acetolactate synthase regulatory subunit